GSILDNRRSVRAFTNKPVAAETLTKIFTLAQRAPSNCNTQPWQVHVASGDTVEKLRKLLPAAMSEGKMSFDFPFEGKYSGLYKERQHDSANVLYTALNIPREEKAERTKWFMKNYTFFDAPHVAFLFLPEQFGIREAADLGMYAQSLMLTLTAFGLASCPQTSLSFFANTIRDELDIDPSNKLLFGLSFGYEEKDDLANAGRVGRAPLEETTIFHN
ncbi:MAG: nitroreductase, partial [Pseudomonadales bacterium]|nr:nitroreductase [Pseudomonadales bacterium]